MTARESKFPHAADAKPARWRRRRLTGRFAQVDRITLLAMGLRMRAVCAELRAQPRFAPKYWGVAWDRRKRRWAARYRDADGKTRTIGYFDDQESAAHAVNAAIRWAGLEGHRKTNPVDADGRVVPRA